jgi:hypothetical protein
MCREQNARSTSGRGEVLKEIQEPRGTDPKEKTRSRYGKKITIQDLGADSSEQYVIFLKYIIFYI